MPDVIGVIFPIPKLYISRFFGDGKTVFIKPAKTFKKLQVGMKFIFYQSQEDTGYVGDALIKNITIARDPFSFFDIYENSIFLTKEELESYIKKIKERSKKHKKGKNISKTKNWLAIELKLVRMYNIKIKPDKFTPIGGKYIYTDPVE